MGLLKFSDGVEIETGGNARTLKLKDGWYAVGHGSLVPCVNEAEAEIWAARLNRRNKKDRDMVDVTRIKQIKGLTDVWPHKQEHYKVDMIGADNKTYEATIHKSEFQIWKWYIAHKHHVRDTHMAALLKAVEEYGSHQHWEGGFAENEDESR